VRTAATLVIDPQSGDVTGTAVPEEYLTPTYRAGWTI